MAGEIIYADLKHRGDGIPPAEKRRAPASCPRWHGVVLKAGGLGHLVLLALVATLSVWAFQGSRQPAATGGPWHSGESRGENCTEPGVISAMTRYFCEPQHDSLAASAGCKLCPQDWQLHGDWCYWLSKQKASWAQGKTSCENQKSQLVVLSDEKEMDYIKVITGQVVWIGFTSRQGQRWVDNTSLSHTKFSVKDTMIDGCGTLQNKTLDVDVCDGEYNWVCQKTPFQLSPSAPGGA